jgi:hypothetical protein
MQQLTCIAGPRFNTSPSISLGHSASVFTSACFLLSCCTAAISSLNPSVPKGDRWVSSHRPIENCLSPVRHLDATGSLLRVLPPGGCAPCGGAQAAPDQEMCYPLGNRVVSTPAPFAVLEVTFTPRALF